MKPLYLILRGEDMNLFYFELKRFLKNPKNKICLLLLALLFVTLFTLNVTTFNKRLLEMDIATSQLNLQQAQQAVKILEKEIKLSPDNKKLKDSLNFAKKEEKIIEQQILSLKESNFEKFAELENELDLSRIRLYSKESEDYQRLDAKIKYHNTIKSVNGKFSPTANSINESAFLVGRSMMSWLSSTTVFIIISVLIADAISNDIESSKIRFYQLIGGRKTKHLILKLIVPIFVVTSITIFSFLLLYLIQGWLFDFGTWKYPYFTLDGSIIPIWEVTLKTCILFISALFFISSLGELLSLVFKRSLVVIGLLSVFLTGFATLEHEEWFQPLKKFLPFEYLGFGQIVNDTHILPDNPFLIGICYLIVLSIIFVTISNKLYKNYYYQ